MSSLNFLSINMNVVRPHFCRAGFTLVELLVAIAVLAIILVAAAKILSTTATLTTVNNKRMDANDQARMVFDCMADDFARMVRRRDVDYLFWKNSPSTTTGTNDAMYFFTEGASYFDSATSFGTGYTTAGYSSPNVELEKNSVSLVGYRVNNNGGTFPATPAADPDYYQLERLGKALSWDGEGYNSGTAAANSKQPNFEVFLTYDPPGSDPKTASSPYSDPTAIAYSAAFFNSTLAGAFSNNITLGRSLTTTPSTVGTEAKNFSDSGDTSYRSVGSQVFRFEYAFQLKDGTFSDKPMMVYSASISNGVPSSTIAGAQRPLPTNDSTAKLTNPGSVFTAPGSRWWDSTNHIGYICLDATPNYAVWHEIGIQDVSAIIVTIAVIDKQGLAFVNAKGGDLSKIAAVLPDYSPAVAWPTGAPVPGNPAYLLDPNKGPATPVSWAYALLPGNGVSTATITGTTKLPQAIISQIRVYQRCFYLNTF